MLTHVDPHLLLVDTTPGATPRVASKSSARAACCSAAADAGAMDGGVMLFFFWARDRDPGKWHRFIDLILFNHQTLGFNHQDWDNGDIMEIDSDMFVALVIYRTSLWMFMGWTSTNITFGGSTALPFWPRHKFFLYHGLFMDFIWNLIIKPWGNSHGTYLDTTGYP